MQPADQILGVELFRVELQRFFQIAHGQPPKLGPAGRRRRRIEDFGANDFGPLRERAGQKLGGKLAVVRIQAGVDRLAAESDDFFQVVEALGAQLDFGGLIEIGLTLVFCPHHRAGC